ncbi:glycine, glutamate and proline-rich protein-like [Saccostrea cucullata]|uniref:glycine, glutamate and proline-rich protein-like n=1 Tax=Saccostrea cuccullata TaxID=36930 RepID=UPI002ED25170
MFGNFQGSILLVFLCVLQSVLVVGDTRCTNKGGTCQSNTITCENGRYQRGLCRGAASRQCCVPSPADRPCANKRGVCQENRMTCNGEYQRGLCGGGATRQCCVPKSSGSTGGSSPGKYNCFGDVTKLNPTGRKNGGISASIREITPDLSRLNTKKKCYVTAGQNNCIHPAVIAAIASRESHAGRLLISTNGYGDNNNAYGTMQCDVRHCPVCDSKTGRNCKTYHWDSCEHINMMTKYTLVRYIKQVKSKHPTWTPEQQQQGGVAAYNFGVSNVRSWKNLDKGSTNDDYSNDVMARAQYLINKQGW